VPELFVVLPPVPELFVVLPPVPELFVVFVQFTVVVVLPAEDAFADFEAIDLEDLGHLGALDDFAV
jgi:hypothetical protein